jgi:hypothetical protein
MPRVRGGGRKKRYPGLKKLWDDNKLNNVTSKGRGKRKKIPRIKEIMGRQ